MTKKRRKLSAAFKAKVAIMAIQGHKTISEIASEFDVHPNQVSDWKKKLIESSTDAFTRTNEKREEDFDAERERLYSQIGQLKVENDFLKKTVGRVD
jgi:transposase